MSIRDQSQPDYLIKYVCKRVRVREIALKSRGRIVDGGWGDIALKSRSPVPHNPLTGTGPRPGNHCPEVLTLPRKSCLQSGVLTGPRLVS